MATMKAVSHVPPTDQPVSQVWHRGAEGEWTRT